MKHSEKDRRRSYRPTSAQNGAVIHRKPRAHAHNGRSLARGETRFRRSMRPSACFLIVCMPFAPARMSKPPERSPAITVTFLQIIRDNAAWHPLSLSAPSSAQGRLRERRQGLRGRGLQRLQRRDPSQCRCVGIKKDSFHSRLCLRAAMDNAVGMVLEALASSPTARPMSARQSPKQAAAPRFPKTCQMGISQILTKD